MSYQNKEILRDKNNRPIPQIWSEDLQDFVPYTGNVAEVQAIKDDLALVKATVGQVKELLTSGEQKVTLSGSVPAIWGANISERPAASEVPVGTQFILANENLDAWVSNGTDWVVI